MRRISKFWTCYCSITLIMIVLVITVITLSFVGLTPRLYVQELYVPALNNSITTYNSSSLNTSIFIDLKFKRVVAYVPILYEDINITLCYGLTKIFSVLPGFVQGRKKVFRRRAVVEGGEMPWEDALREISDGSTMALTVEVATTFRAERCNDDGCSYIQPKAMVVAANLRLDGSGELSGKPVRLRWWRSKEILCRTVWWVGFGNNYIWIRTRIWWILL